MFSKIYLGVLAVAILVMGTITFISFGWLGSIGDPAITVENYRYYSGIGWTALWISFLALLILANILLWKDRKAWALWTSLAFFVVFIIVQTFWLEKAFYDFWKANQMTGSSLFLKPFLGVTAVTVAAVGVFFNQFILIRLRDKMFGKDNKPDENESSEEKEEIDSEPSSNADD